MADDDVLRKLEEASVGTLTYAFRLLNEITRTGMPSVGMPPPSIAPSATTGDPARDALYGLARVLLNGYVDSMRLQQQWFDSVANGLRTATRPQAGRLRERLQLEGRLGDLATGRFHVENEQQTTIELTVAFSELECVQDGRRVTTHITVGSPAGGDETPRRARRIGPGERRAFDVAVRIDSAVFRTGSDYTGTIHVLRDGEIIGEVSLALRVPADGAS